MAEIDIAAMRIDRPLENARHQALRDFTRHMLDTRGWAKLAAINALMDTGYTNATILGVLLAISMKTLSNYTNHIANTPVDTAFEKFSWQKQ